LNESLKSESFLDFWHGFIVFNKNFLKEKIPDFWGFCMLIIFLEFIFEKTLDFSELRNHNNRASSWHFSNGKEVNP